MTKTKHLVSIEAAVTAAGLELPPAPSALASYVPARRSGNLVYVSGQVPLGPDGPLAIGQVPTDISVEAAAKLAERCALQALAALQSVLDPGEGLDHIVRLGGFVACPPSFTDHPKVINGASNLLQQLFGAPGQHARAAVGVPSLPLGVPVEIEFLFAVA